MITPLTIRDYNKLRKYAVGAVIRDLGELVAEYSLLEQNRVVMHWKFIEPDGTEYSMYNIITEDEKFCNVVHHFITSQGGFRKQNYQIEFPSEFLGVPVQSPQE